MTYQHATREYLLSLNLNYEDSGRKPPKHQTVTRAIYPCMTVFPWHDQELHEWIICYEDGTYDARRLASSEYPHEGRFFSRIEAACAKRDIPWEHNFVLWDAEGLV